jgi:hypothetical protein
MFQWMRIRSSLALVLVLPAIAWSAQKPGDGSTSREAFYRCKDARGQTHYGDSMPFQCSGLDTEVLNDRGMVLRVVEGDATREARIAREAVENQAKKEREQRAQRDHMLLDTYLTVAEIERLRDQRLEQLASQYHLTEQDIRDMRERQARLATQIARFRPYNDAPNAPALPDHYGEEMVNTVKDLAVLQERLAKNRDEQEEVRTSFGVDIKRFKELKRLP